MSDGQLHGRGMHVQFVQVLLLWGLLCTSVSPVTVRPTLDQATPNDSHGGSSHANTTGGDPVANTTVGSRRLSREEIVKLFSEDFHSEYHRQNTPVLHCRLSNAYMSQPAPEGFFEKGSKFVDVSVYFHRETVPFIQDKLRSVYRPNRWTYAVADDDGLELLLLEDHFHFLPVWFMRPEIWVSHVAVMEKPRGCLLNLTEEEALTVIRDFLLVDFERDTRRPKDSEDLEETMYHLYRYHRGHQICNVQVFDDHGIANFSRICCRRSMDGMECREIKRSSWAVQLLINAIYVVKVLLILYSPSFIPKSLYARAFEGKEYIYHADTPRALDEPIRVRFKVTDDLKSVNHSKELKKKTVSLGKLKGMASFKERVKTCKVNTVYEAVIQYVRLYVKPRRLLDENTIPVGLLRVIYHNLCLCHIKHLSPLKKCCRSYAFPHVSWYDCGLFIGKSLLLGLCTVPWMIRLFFYFTTEQYELVHKNEKAAQLGLQIPYRGSLIPYLTPLHVLFVMTYIVLSVDFLVYGLINKAMKEQFRFVLRKTLREMREQTRQTACAAITRCLVRPCEKFGVLGVFVALPCAVVLAAILPLAVLFIFPSLNLTCRLLIHLLFYLLPAKLTDKCPTFVQLKKQLAREAKHVALLQLLIIPMCLVSFWFFTLLLVETFSFLVEVLIFIMIAIIIDSEDSMQYVSIAFLVSVYARSTFNDIHKMYMAFHKQIHSALIDMEEEEITRVAEKDELFQDNTAFHVKSSRERLHPDLVQQNIRLVVKNGQLKWETNGILVFLDTRDTPYIPQKFFHQTILFNHWGAPGPVYANLVKGLWSFSKILLFLLFVLTVVAAYSSYFSVSGTNKTLATIATGFIPQIFKTAFSGDGAGTVDTSSVQFKAEFNKTIEDFTQTWPVSDIGGKRPGLQKCQGDEGDGIISCVARAWGCFSRSFHGSGDEGIEAPEETDKMENELFSLNQDLTNDKEEVTITEMADVEDVDMILHVNRRDVESAFCF